MSYSEDYRSKVLSFMESGATIEQASQHFSVGTSSIKRWRRNKRDTGKVMGPGRPKKAYKIDEEKLKEYVKDNPDAFLEEMAEHFGVTSSGIFKALKRLKITRKKSLPSTKRDVKQSD